MRYRTAMITYVPESTQFDRTAGTLLIGVDTVDLQGHTLALQAEAESRSLHAKPEFHSTVIGFRNGKAIKELLAKLSGDDRKRRLQSIERLANELDWKFTTEGQKIYFIEKEYSHPSGDIEHRASIVQLIDMPDLAIFYQRLNGILRSNFIAPPPHITLFVGGSDPEKSTMGIGIDSREAFEALKPEEIAI